MQVTKTAKVKFLDLNHAKAQLLADMEQENTRLANELLAIPYKERRKLTTSKVDSSLRSALVNQTIRHRAVKPSTIRNFL